MNSKIQDRDTRNSTCSNGSTDLDSSFENADLGRTNPIKHKTELCKTYSLLGYCNYYHKCRFAHGPAELVRTQPKHQTKSRKCNGFWKKGSCCYGLRCQFGHAEIQWQDRCCLLAL